MVEFTTDFIADWERWLGRVGLCLKVLFLLVVNHEWLGKDIHQSIIFVLRDCIHLSMAKDRLRLRSILSYCFSAPLTFFSASSLFLLNGENVRMFLLFHAFSLSSCYSLYILHKLIFFSSCMFFSTLGISSAYHHYHQRNTLGCCAVIFISQSFECAKHKNLKKKKGMLVWFIQQPLTSRGQQELNKEPLSVTVLCQQMLTHTC